MNDRDKSKPQKEKGGAGEPRPRWKPSFRLWLLLLLIIWNAILLWPQQKKSEVNIPYSAFITQVRAGNVVKVSIIGPQINGTLAKPILWPPEITASSSQNQPEAAGKAENPKASPSPESDVSKNARKNEPNENKGAKKPEGTSLQYTEFSATFPESVGDPGLISLLESQNVTVEAKVPTKPSLVTLFVDWGPMLLLVGYFVWMGQKSISGQSSLFGIGKTKARRYSSEQTKVTFRDVFGAGEAKDDLQELVDFLRNPQKYHKLGAHMPRGTLLVGPPGTGKTLLAKAVAGEAGVPFYSLSASEFVEMFVGVGASRVRDLFQKAKASAPSIIFVDELDAVGRRRSAGVGAVNDEREQTLNQFLVEMDGFDEHQEVIVLAATNRPDVLDPALLRPGRFDRQITVPLSDREGRAGILRIHSRELPLAPDVDLNLLSSKTVGMSGADLANICNEAALFAARRGSDKVTMADFEEAIDKIVLGGERPSLANPHDREVVAYHESGHAMVAWLTPEADPVHKVTIIPHGRALGVTEQVPGEDRYNYSRTYLLTWIDVMLGGRVSEQIVFGDITTGAENDLQNATRLARRMVTRWGMGSLGPLVFESDEEQPFLGYEQSRGRDYGESTATRIDEDVRKIMEERLMIVTSLLSCARKKLDQLAKTLLREETVEEQVLERILGPRAKAGSN